MPELHYHGHSQNVRQGKLMSEDPPLKPKPGTPRVSQLIRFVVSLLLTTWWGGLTFYSAVVISVGTNVLSATAQGFVTQSVTHYLNGLLAIVLLVSGWNVFTTRIRIQIVAWVSLLTSLPLLMLVHGQLDQLLDSETHSVSNPDEFYGRHQIYLWLTIVQWLAGIVLLWFNLFPPSKSGNHSAEQIPTG